MLWLLSSMPALPVQGTEASNLCFVLQVHNRNTILSQELHSRDYTQEPCLLQDLIYMMRFLVFDLMHHRMRFGRTGGRERRHVAFGRDMITCTSVEHGLGSRPGTSTPPSPTRCGSQNTTVLDCFQFLSSLKFTFQFSEQLSPI